MLVKSIVVGATLTCLWLYHEVCFKLESNVLPLDTYERLGSDANDHSSHIDS